MASVKRCSHCGSFFHEKLWCPKYKRRQMSNPACPGDVSTLFFVNTFPSLSIDLHPGQHKCKHCGSNSHPLNWCANCRQSDFQVFKVTDLPGGPLSDPHHGGHMCQLCGSNTHPMAWCYWKDRPGSFESVGSDIVCDKCQKDKTECRCIRGPFAGFRHAWW